MKGKQTKNIMRGMVALAVLFLVSIGIYVYATQEVKIAVTQTPNVDVVLTKLKTKADLRDFEGKLKQKLIAENVMTEEQINAGKLNVQSVETSTLSSNDVGAAEIFQQWKKYPALSIVGNANYNADWRLEGDTIRTGADVTWTGYWNKEDEDLDQDITISFDSYSGDNTYGDPIGFTFRMTEPTTNVFSFYAIELDHAYNTITLARINQWDPAHQSVSSMHTGPVYDGVLHNCSGKILQKVSCNLPTSQWLSTKIQIEGNTIRVYMGSNKVIEVTENDSDMLKVGSYGPWVASNPYAKFRNVSIETKKLKKFSEVLQAPNWREGATKVLINVEDQVDDQFSNEAELTEIIAKLMNDDVYYIGWGTETNKGQIEELIKKNDNKGTYIANGNSDEAIDVTVEYIKSLIGENTDNNVIVREYVSVQQTSPVNGVETPTEAFPDGVWKVEHDENYYENPEQQYEYDGMYSNTLINSFDNVGKYTIYCEDKYVTDIYAHRRPVSTFTTSLSMARDTLTLQSNSYDLDIETSEQSAIREEQLKNRGIKEETWEYKEEDATEWIKVDPQTNDIGKHVIIDNLEPETKYMVKLTVTDYQGTKTSSVKYIVTGESEVKPVASFKVVEKTISVYDKLNIIDESYDPSGASLTYSWKVKKDGKDVKTFETLEELLQADLQGDEFGTGTYTIELTVKKTANNNEITSNVFSQKITVTEDVTAPAITVTPTNDYKYNEEINVQVHLKDEESGLKSFKYAFLKTDEATEEVEEQEPEEQSTRQVRATSEEEQEEVTYTEVALDGNKSTQEITIPATDWDENLYLHIIAEDNKGNKSEERITGKYYIEPTYKLVIQAVESQENGSILGFVKDAKYTIIGRYEDGSTIEIAKDEMTDSNGKITIPKAKLHKVVALEIENTEAPKGYEKAECKNVAIDTSTYKIVVDETSTSSDIVSITNAIEVKDEDLSLSVKVPLHKKQFELKITNVDSTSNNYIDNSVFVLKHNSIEIARGTTIDGIVTLKGDIQGVNQEGSYTLEQESVHEAYNKVNNVTLKIQFDDDGNVKEVSKSWLSNNNNVTIPDASKAEVTVKNDRIDQTSFSVNLTIKSNEDGTPLENTTYKIKVKTENNLEYTTQSATSNADGNLTIDGLYGTGKLRLTFINEQAAAGYAKDVNNSNSITITRDSNGTIALVNDTPHGIYEREENGTIYVTLTQSLKTSVNTLKVKVCSQEAGNPGLEDIGMSIYDAMGTLIGSGKTDENGIFEITGITVDGSGDVLYKLVPDDSSVIGPTIIFAVSYNDKNQIINASNITNRQNVNIYYQEIDEDTCFKRVANVDIGIANVGFNGRNTLTIIKEDILNSSIKIKDVCEQVTIVGMQTNSYITNDNGEITLNLPDNNNIVIQMKEVQAAPGYRTDKTLKTVELRRDENGTLTIKSLTNIADTDARIDENGNLIIIDHCRSLESAIVNFKISTVNQRGILKLGGAEFTVKEATTGYEQTIITNTSGYISVPVPFVTTEGKSYEFTIEQTGAVYSYKQIDRPIKVKVIFTKEGSLVIYKATNYLDGTEFLKDKTANYDVDNNQVDISLKIMNERLEGFGDGKDYDIDLVKLDRNGNIVAGSEYDVEIRPFGESRIVSDACEVTQNIEIEDLIIEQDKTTIILKEVTAAIGCNIDKDIKTVTLMLDNSGNIIVDQNTTTSTNVQVEINEDTARNRTVVKIIITEDTTTTGGGSGSGSTNPSTPVVPTTLTLNLFNRSYGDWYYSHALDLSIYEPIWRHTNHKVVVKQNAQTLGATQKLLRIFDTMPNHGWSNDANSHDFGFIKAGKIEVEARLVNNGVVDTAVYETAKAEDITNNNQTGTHKIALQNDYKNKTVEFTLIESIPAYNYKRHTNDMKFILEFDENGKVKEGRITQGVDLEELAIGGISASGIVDNIQVINTSYVRNNAYVASWRNYMFDFFLNDAPYRYEYDTCDINNYNTIGQDQVYIGYLDKKITGDDGRGNPLKININLIDEDTDEGVDAQVSLIVEDKTPDAIGSNRIVESHSLNITNSGVITLDNTYANRTLLFTLQQMSVGTKENLRYVDKTAYQTQFQVETDDDGNIISFKELTSLDFVKGKAVNTVNTVQYNIYQELQYNFALNLTKFDENDKPLEGVRVQTVTSLTESNALNSREIFRYGSKLTDENGNVKLKIVLPTTGEDKYYGRTIEITLNEYYVPDNYKAITGKKIRITFNEAGEIVGDPQVVDDRDEQIVKITAKNNIQPEDVESISLDISMVNSKITDKPSIEIENVDIDNDETKISGTQYEIEVMDVNDYAINNVNINETKYSQLTNTDGKTTVNFDNAHALRTMIYRIIEKKTADSYRTNEDIILKVVFDEEGKIKETPEILNLVTLQNAQNEDVPVAKIVGDPRTYTNISLKIVNELEPKFTLAITRKDTEENVLTGRKFTVTSEEKDANGTTYTSQEVRVSHETTNGYEVGFKQDPANKTIRYTIKETVGNTDIERGKVEVTFDQYGNVIEDEITKEGNYITEALGEENTSVVNVTIEAEVFRIAIDVDSIGNEPYSLEGYTFEIKNDKGETSDVTLTTDVGGYVIEIVGECYKGETIKYTLTQKECPIDYNDIEDFTFTLVFNDDGTIQSCTPTTGNSQDNNRLWDVVTTQKPENSNINMQLKIYTTAARRNKLQMTLLDEDTKEPLNESEYKITDNNDEFSLWIADDGKGTADLGSYKKYANQTVTFTVKQTQAKDNHMINDIPIQVAVTFDQEGIITAINQVATDGHLEIKTNETLRTDTIVLQTLNRRKEVMDLEVQSTQSASDRVYNAEFKIIEKDKSDLYSDTKVTDQNGQAKLFVGPYYKDEEVTYKIINTIQAKEFKKLPDSEFTLTYDGSGNVTNVAIPESMQKYMEININNQHYTSDIKITMKTDPLFTVGVTTIDEATKNDTTPVKITGGEYEIVQENNPNKKDTVVTTTNYIAHAAIGETEETETLYYDIIERKAPGGYKYRIGKDEIIGKLQVTYDAKGQIVPNTIVVLEGSNYITVNNSTDKNNKYDIDITIACQEQEGFKVVIETYDILSDTTKLEATYHGVLNLEGEEEVTTDPATGIAILDYGKINNVSRTQLLTISQSNVHDAQNNHYTAISKIKISIQFDESGKIKLTNNERQYTVLTTSGLAIENQVFTIDSVGDYIIRITVKNNPQTTIKINNMAEGTNQQPVNSTLVVSSQGISPITMERIVDGEYIANLTSIPKNTTVMYLIAQSNVPNGYVTNKDIKLFVTYDENGKITNARIDGNSSDYADSSIVEIANRTAYQVELNVKNRKIFEICLSTTDAFDNTIKLSGVNVAIYRRYDNDFSKTLITDANGEANTELGATYANISNVRYEIDVITNVPGYDDHSYDIHANIYVTFDMNGDVIDVNPKNPNSQIEVSCGSGNAIEVKVKYTPVLNLNVIRRSLVNNTPLSGRQIIVTSSAMNTQNQRQVIKSTDANGKVSTSNAGLISANNTVTYTITEQINSRDYTLIENMGTVEVYVTYDADGKITDFNTNDSDHVSFDENDKGTRTLNVTIGSDSKATIAIIDADYYIHTQRIQGKFEITSSMGEKMEISSTTGTTNVIERLGKLYPNETITYTLHQIETAYGYLTIPDTTFTVRYNSDGTIAEVQSNNTDILVVRQTTNSPTQTIPSITMEVHSRPQLLLSIQAVDKLYGSGVRNMGFKVKNEKTGKETTVDALTDENGNLVIPVNNSDTSYESYENQTVTYTITQTETYGGYKMAQPFQVTVEYGSLGTIIENGSFVETGRNYAKIVNGYSETLYNQNKLRGIKVKVELETDFGIGIEKVDVYGNKMNGVEFAISATDITTNADPTGAQKVTNEAGEITHYFGAMPAGRTIQYVISEVQAPKGYRKTQDITITVRFDNEGKVQSYQTDPEINPRDTDSNIEIKGATSSLLTMEDSKESVHLKIKIKNDDRVTYKIVNREVNEQLGINLPIEGATFHVAVTDANHNVVTQEIVTNRDGEAFLKNVDASGNLKFTFNQTEVPEGYKANDKNQGHLTINKSSDVYSLTYVEGTDDLKHDIDSQEGIVTIYLYNESDITINLFDVDAETYDPTQDTYTLVTQGKHTIQAKVGEKTEDFNTILNKQDTITYNNGEAYVNTDGLLTIKLGSAYDLNNSNNNLVNKKVVYIIETPEGQTPYKPTEDADDLEDPGPVVPQQDRYQKIGSVYLVVEYDSQGRIERINGKSSRIMNPTTLKKTDHVINTIIGYGDMNFYTVKIVKEDMVGARVNGVKFDVQLSQGEETIINKEDLETKNITIEDRIIESGVTQLTNVKTTGDVKVTIKEKEVPEGFKKLEDDMVIEFNATLDKDTDPDNVKLQVDSSTIQKPNHVKVDIDEDARMVTITIKNTSILTLNINKTDESGNALLDMEFNVTIQEANTNNIETLDPLKTDAEGKIEAEITNKYAGKGIFLHIKEKADDNYEPVDFVVYAYVDEEGKIPEETCYIVRNEPEDVDYATLERTDKSITLDITNKLSEYAKPYSVHITKTDENDNEIELAGALLQVKVTPEKGISAYKAVYTDANGNIDLEGLIGSGKIKIEIKEVQAPDGYIIPNEEKYFEYEVNKTEGSLSKISSNQSDDLWEVDQNNKEIKIKINNSTEKTGIAIEKVDSINPRLKITGAKFTLTSNEPNPKTYEATSNNNGIAYFSVDKPENGTSNNIITYTLKETVAPNGYQLDNEERNIVIQYSQAGTIENIILNNGLTKLQQNDNYMKVQLANTQETLSIGSYNVEIINVDKDTKVGIPGATFEIDMTHTVGVTHVTTTDITDQDGKIYSAAINGAGDITINLTNTIAGNGYIINSNNNYVKFHRNDTTGTITITESNNVNLEYDEQNNILKIYVESEKEQNKYSFVLNIRNKRDDTLINDTTAKYQLTLGTKTIEVYPNQDGKIIVSGLDIEDVQNFMISVQEMQAPSGFNAIADVQQVSVDVVQAYDIRTLQTAVVTAGNSIRLDNISTNSIEASLLYTATGDEEYYIESDIYKVTENTIERVKPNTTVEAFFNNIDTNGTMKLYDVSGNEKDMTALVGTTDVLKVTYEGVVHEYQVAVLGDLNGDGEITATDISMLNQVVINKRAINTIQQKAADLDFNERISATDLSKINQAFMGKITL